MIIQTIRDGRIVSVDTRTDPMFGGTNSALAAAIAETEEILDPQSDPTMNWFALPGAYTNDPGADDGALINNLFQHGAVVSLLPLTYTVRSTVTAHEGMYVRGAGRQRTFVSQSGFSGPAFQWTPANSSSYSQFGTGGITGVSIVGQSPVPTDGSIGVQMGDIVQLETDVYVTNLQYGLLLNNQFFQAEQGSHRVMSHGCTNPVVLQCAATGGASRNGSFDRTELTVYTDDTMSGAFGNGVVQLLAGAQILEGNVTIYGNLSGTGQAGVYALYVSGAAPAGPTGFSSMRGGKLTMGVEYDGTGTAPGGVLVAASSFVDGPTTGIIRFDSFGSSSITGTWSFSGPITGDAVLVRAAGGYSSFAPTLSGLTGSFFVAQNGNLGQAYIEGSVSVPASTSIPHNTVISSGVPAAFAPSSGSRWVDLILQDGGGGASAIAFPCQISSAGNLTYFGVSYTTTGASSIFGSAVYRVG